MTIPSSDSLIDAISDLALDMARLCPECAEKANRLVALVAQLKPAPLDRGAIQDAIGSEIVESDVSDLQVRTATEAVMRATREQGEAGR